MKELLQRLAEFRLGTYVIFLGLTGYFAATQPGFLDSANLLSLARQYSELGIVAVGMTLVIATGGIDISVGGIVGLTAMLVGVLGVTLGWNIWAAAGVGLCAAAAVGAVNGFAIAYMGVQPVLVTLATMSLTRGIAYILTSGTSLSINQPGFQAIASSDIGAAGGALPTPSVIMALVFIAAAFVLRKTVHGRYLLALGQSEQAAALSGIRVRRVKFAAYFGLALLGGLAGVLLTSRLATAFPDAGRNYEFEAITAVVLGGTSLAGGEGSLLGTLFGVATMAVLRNGLSLGGQTDVVRTQMLAVALITAVVIDLWRKRMLRSLETRA